MKFRNLPPLLLAAILQIAPVCRTIYTFNALPGCAYAIVSPWVLGAAALFGYHAVAGASVVMTSPTTARATNGVLFKYTITTSTYYSDMRYTASGTPTGVPGVSGSVSPIVTGTPTAAGTFVMNVIAADTGGPYGQVSENVTVTVVNNGPPTITTEPQNVAVTQGSAATFNVSAPAATAYQWFFNSNLISLATNTSYTIASAQGSNIGNYFVTVSNAYGSTNSTLATLTVYYPPAITTQPASQVSNQGSNVTFNAVASGTAPLYYQWYDGTNSILNATGATFQILNAQGTNAGSYTLVVTNLYGSSTSSAAVLTIAGDLALNNGPPSLLAAVYGPETTNAYTAKTGNPSAGTPPGTQVYTGAKLSGTNYTAQLWGALGTNLAEAALSPIPNATTFFKAGGLLSVPSPNPVVPGAVEGQIATLELRVWDNKIGTVTNWNQVLANTNVNRGVSTLFNSQPLGGVSAAPNLIGITSFNLHLPLAPAITSQPASVSVPAGSNATFAVAVTGDAPLYYQWQLNDSPIANATNATYGLTNVQTGQSGSAYSVAISNASGSLVSSNAILTVTSTGVAPFLLTGSMQSNQFVITFPATLGQAYVAQYSTNLVPLSWTTLTNITAAGTNVVIYDSITTSSARFYRINATN